VNRRLELLRRLADGREHSGEALAVALEVSRAAVWKQVRRLEDWGLQIEAVPGRGYRLTRPVNLLDERALREALPEAAAARLRTLTVAAELKSTNTALLAVNDLPPGRFDACLAEFQSRGRGRRGRDWVAPFASGLCLSVNWSFAEVPPRVSALSLAVGVAITRALAACEVNGVRHDTGNKLGYLKAVVYFALRRPDLAEKFSVYLTSLDLNVPARQFSKLPKL